MKAAPLSIKNVTKVYTDGPQRVSALSAITLTLRPQERAVIIGPNGSGKSTLLKLVAGIEQPSSGVIMTAAPPAYVPQRPSLLPWRSVEQNLLLVHDVQQITPRPTRAAIGKLLKDFGLVEFRDFYPGALSGGMQQKVALLRSVMTNPSVLLLDEPFAALDAITRLEVQRWLLDLTKKMRASFLCVTHDIQEAVLLADTIYVLSTRPGHIQQTFRVSARVNRQALATKLQALLVSPS
jgi:ABC-type nitrate/sulfonate/bicarbonate transport system ATPase subunit